MSKRTLPRLPWFQVSLMTHIENCLVNLVNALLKAYNRHPHLSEDDIKILKILLANYHKDFVKQSKSKQHE